jgi:glycine cleavage system H protein
MSVPTNLKYTAEHEWLDIQGDIATVGITAFAADALGDIVYVDLPGVGTVLQGGEPCGEIESTKSVSDLHAPADGEVTEINDAAVDEPGVLNLEPFKDGWLFRMRISDSSALLDAAEYQRLTDSQ